MASTAASAPSTAHAPLQIAGRVASSIARALERIADAERDQLFLWVPVMLGGGVALWFILPHRWAWVTAMLALGGIALVAGATSRGGRVSRIVMAGALLMLAGMALVWARVAIVAAPVMNSDAVVRLLARVERVQPLPARDLIRLRLAPIGWTSLGQGRSTIGPMPTHLRVSIASGDAPTGLMPGAVIRLGARLVPPPGAGVPGGYDYARVAWFDRIGGTGRGFGPVEIVHAADAGAQRGWDATRARLSAHIQHAVPGGAGAIAAALATGDQGAMPIADAEAMRRAGLAHLLSVSGLHITAVVGGVMLVVLRLLALSPWLALRCRLPLVAALAGAAAAIGYTLLTGAEVPTVRSCVAALMVLTALALGRQAVTLRLVAVGALVVLVLWPEAVIGPSFQLSFAAVASIIALHEHPRIKAWFDTSERPLFARIALYAGSLLLTGIVVEATLAPIALFHFHKAGLYGSVANIIAIPLTTFVVMPAEALALALDTVGLGAPIWWIVAQSLAVLLAIAHYVADAPGAVAALPTTSWSAFALMVGGGLWLALWRTRWRALGLVPLALGAVSAVLTPAPDILVTGDGRHVAVRTSDGHIALLRDRAGDYVRAMLTENSGVDDEPVSLSDTADARCTRDACLVDRTVGARRWRILALRSAYHLPIADLVAACGQVDIAIADRRLPRTCHPRWLKLDRPVLRRTGGVAITLGGTGTGPGNGSSPGTGSSSTPVRLTTVKTPGDDHPWLQLPPPASYRVNRSGGAARRAFPAPAPDVDRTAADHRRGSPDRAESSPLRAGNI